MRTKEKDQFAIKIAQSIDEGLNHIKYMAEYEGNSVYCAQYGKYLGQKGHRGGTHVIIINDKMEYDYAWGIKRCLYFGEMRKKGVVPAHEVIFS